MKNKTTKKLGRVVKRTDMPDLTERFCSEQLAKAITAKRTSMQLKLTDVAATLSISKPTLIKIEKGESKINFAILLKVMEYLGLSFQVIADDLPTNSQSKETSDDEWY